MTVQECVELAQDYLAKADSLFACGDIKRGSDEIFQAAAHAVMAVAIQREWDIDETHCSINVNANRLAYELGEPRLSEQFGLAQKIFSNFAHDEVIMEDYEIERDRLAVHRFVNRVLSQPELLSESR